MKSKNLRFQKPLKLSQLILIKKRDLKNRLLNLVGFSKMSKICTKSSLKTVLL